MLRLALVLISVLIFSSPATSAKPVGDCMNDKAATSVLIWNNFFMEATYEKDHFPAAIYANDHGVWIEVVLKGQMFCITAQGRAFHRVKERKA